MATRKVTTKGRAKKGVTRVGYRTKSGNIVIKNKTSRKRKTRKSR